MQGNVEQSEAFAAQAERLALSLGASFLLAMLQVARGISAIGAGRHWEAYEHLRRLFIPSDPAFNSGLQFFGLADFVEAGVFSGNADAARRAIEEAERISAPMPVPWVKTMLNYGKALLAAPADAEPFFLEGLGPGAKNWPFLRGRLLLAYGEWLRRQRRSAKARAPLREARDIFDALGASLGAIARARNCEPRAKPAAGERSAHGRRSPRKSFTSRNSRPMDCRTRRSASGCICLTALSAITFARFLRRLESRHGLRWAPLLPRSRTRLGDGLSVIGLVI